MEKIRYLIHYKKRFIIILLLAVIAVGGGGGYYVYRTLIYQPTTEDIQNKMAQEVKKKQQEVLGVVSEQITLPTGEEPIFATVSDKDALQNQDFFKGSQNGDKILMYRKHKKAYLYRPSTKKVLAVAPLKYEADQPKASASASTATPSATIAVPGLQ